MKVVTLLLAFLLSCNCNKRPNDRQSEGDELKSGSPVTAKAAIGKDFTFEVINASANTFGYRIFSDQKLLIQQSSIPGLPGKKGFATKATARRVAELVISKLQKGEMPPTVSLHELKKLNAIE